MALARFGRSGFGGGLSPAQMALARRIEAAGLASISQAVKAFDRKAFDRIEAWKAELTKQEVK